ncbi:hypothetical protein P3T76_001860 [Phytophthora citrophthora]|uniref:Uncharacterized protein n=1 Tax=Phytophthora citrophthora TaxID=4793 RepID=A0AAD9GWZ0_9STRA|nr:hypothetical protein P3T76_001860 [Phytophthora citrophthora]
MEYPLAEEERRYVGLYRRSLYEARRGMLPHQEDRSGQSVLTHTPPLSPGHQQQVLPAAPSCRASDQANEQGIVGDLEFHRRSGERRDPEAVHPDHRRVEEIPPRCVEYGPPHQQEEPDHHARTGHQWRDDRETHSDRLASCVVPTTKPVTHLGRSQPIVDAVAIMQRSLA